MSKVVFERTKALTANEFSYCAGCTHGIIHRLVAEVLEELNLMEQAIGISPVGCAVTNYNNFNCDMVQAAHGRGPAVATGIKRVLPGRIVFTYQGDGDLASIGTAEIVHAAHRGEKITVIFVNNAIYGMTGGQMAPTTLIGQKTSTSPNGRTIEQSGAPIRMSELLATIPGATYIERVSVHNPAHVRRAKQAVKRAFQTQIDKKGFSLIEFISTCPVNWGMTPNQALKWAEENMIAYYPLGIFRDDAKEARQ
ncbi:MAG: thiamine pyrophosphate-dependent enzyme [Bacilli bacterium]|nr:thiamine pyrophosphate-dependent enzyme [Bacilli bacterium]